MEEDLVTITSIHLSRTIAQDKLIQKHSINGMFNVKSTYHIARKVLSKEIHQMHQKRPTWKTIWQVKIMSKVKYFIWRLLNGFLSVCAEFMKKGIQIINMCPVYGEQNESLFHVFFACKLSCEVQENQCPNGLPINQNLWEGLEG